jgi:hypothetical protein
VRLDECARFLVGPFDPGSSPSPLGPGRRGCLREKVRPPDLSCAARITSVRLDLPFQSVHSRSMPFEAVARGEQMPPLGRVSTKPFSEVFQKSRRMHTLLSQDRRPADVSAAVLVGRGRGRLTLT